MEIKELNAAQLQEFIDSEEFANMPVVPISRHRALSQVRNPRVQPQDVLLLLAYNAGKMIGYLGVLADTVYLKDKPEHAGWLSCIWVDESARGQGVAKQLLQRALEKWNGKILAAEFTPVAYKIYERSEAFVDLAKPEGIRAYMRLNLHKILPPKKKVFSLGKGVLKMGDAAANTLNNLFLESQKKVHKPKKVVWEFVTELDDETADFIADHQQDELMHKGKDELNWILKYPWIITAPFEDEISRRYHFTSVSRDFKTVAVKFFSQLTNEMVGFVLLTLRDGHVKTPYFYASECWVDEIGRFITWFMITENAEMLTTFQPGLVNFFNRARMGENKKAFFKVRPQQRHYIISKNLAGNMEEVKLQDGAGDVGFT